MSRAQRSARHDRTEAGKRLDAVLAALDELYEVAARADRPALRLVSPAAETIDRDTGAELRGSLVAHGWNIWAMHGELGLFDALRYVMAARPARQMWNRTILSTLWAEIGVGGRKGV
jgi:hypothetical protein